MQPLQFEYTTRELFGNHFPYWPAYELLTGTTFLTEKGYD